MAADEGPMRASFSSSNTEQVTYSSLPACASSGHTASRMRSCCCVNAATSLARRSHFPSGCRRTTPEAVQGTSARMRSNGRPSHHGAGSAASPRTTRTRRRAMAERARLSRTRTRRAASRRAREVDVGALEMCVVLPPGAAHASSTRMAVGSVEQRRGELRAEVLHGERALGDSRQSVTAAAARR
jgi:hypothetical protein